MAAACGACPETMAALSQAPTMRGCSLGYAFFSVLAPGTRIEPHCALHPLFLDRSATFLSRARVQLAVWVHPLFAPGSFPSLSSPEREQAVCWCSGGASNLRLRCHVPLQLPTSGRAAMRVGTAWREWRQASTNPPHLVFRCGCRAPRSVVRSGGNQIGCLVLVIMSS